MVTDIHNQAKASFVNVTTPRGFADDADYKPTFDEKQQQYLNDLISKKQGEAAATVRAELATERASKATLESDLAAARSALAAAKTPISKDKANDKVDELTARLQEVENVAASTKAEYERLQRQYVAKEQEVSTVKSEKLDIQKVNLMREAASKIGFVDVSDAIDLHAKHVKWDDTRRAFVVTTESGTERLNSSLAPMSLEEYFTEIAAKKPYLVRSDARGGIGSTEATRSGLSNNGKFTVEQIFGPKSSGALANQLGLKDPAEYRRLKAIAVQNGLA